MSKLVVNKAAKGGHASKLTCISSWIESDYRMGKHHETLTPNSLKKGPDWVWRIECVSGGS